MVGRARGWGRGGGWARGLWTDQGGVLAEIKIESHSLRGENLTGDGDKRERGRGEIRA